MSRRSRNNFGGKSFSTDKGGLRDRFVFPRGGFAPRSRSTAAAAAWTPASLSPSLWLKASDGVTKGTDAPQSGSDFVSSWADQSGNARNATGTATRRPKWISAAVNGLDAIEFDGAALQQMTFAGVPVPTNGSVIVVQRTTTVGLLGYDALLYAAASAPSIYIEHNTSHRPALAWSGAEQNPGPASLVDSSWHAARWMWGASNLSYARDNASNTQVARGGLTASGTFIELGTGANTVLNSYTRIAELIVVPTELTAGETTSLNSYLSARYAIW